ncbi:hypothetical protein BGX30_003199 [Mortierella sp. GBA39]|nr:hypothetical protein BGX30_003199 [Mortierella sp. GBA39]
MSHAPNPTAPDVDIDIHTTLRLMQEQMQQQQAFMQQQQVLLQQQQSRIQQLETSSGEQDGKVVYKPRATTLQLYQELLDVYPAIAEPKFFDSELPKDHDVFYWNDFHYTEGMDYMPPPVLQHSEVSLTDTAKRHERDLATIQGYLAHTTRNDKEESLFTLESLAAKKAATDLVRKTCKKYEPPNDKTKKPDNKSTKDKSGTGDKPKGQQSGKSQHKDKSGYKSDSGKSGYKSDGSKSDGKPRYKSGGGQGWKQPGQGKDGEKSD